MYVTKQSPRSADKQRKREEAEERNARWAALSYKDQLASLDRRLGKGQGARKQRKRILEKMS